MKKIITLLLALVLCFGLTGCDKLDYIFNGAETKEPEPLPLIYERKIVSELTLEDKGKGYYQAEINGMMKFDYFPKNIALFTNGNISYIEPERVVYANVIANDNTTSTWYVATFNHEAFNFPTLSAGTSNYTVYAEDTKGTMYVSQTLLTLTSEKALTGCTIYDELSNVEHKLFNDFNLKNGEVMFEITGRDATDSLNLSGYPIEFKTSNPLKHEQGDVVEIEAPETFGYELKGWLNEITGYIYVPDANGKITFQSQGGALRLCAIWQQAPNVSTGPEIEL